MKNQYEQRSSGRTLGRSMPGRPAISSFRRLPSRLRLSAIDSTRSSWAAATAACGSLIR